MKTSKLIRFDFYIINRIQFDSNKWILLIWYKFNWIQIVFKWINLNLSCIFNWMQGIIDEKANQIIIFNCIKNYYNGIKYK